MRFAVVARHWLATMAVLLLIGGGVSWSPAARACTVTTVAPATPSGFAATVNDDSILLQWNAAPEADKVYQYDIYRGEPEDEVLTWLASLETVPLYHVDTDTLLAAPDPPTSFPVTKHDLVESGKTYVFQVVAIRRDNCGKPQHSKPSSSVTATFPEF